MTSIVDKAKDLRPKRRRSPYDGRSRAEVLELVQAYFRGEVGLADVGRVMGFAIQYAPSFILKVLRTELEAVDEILDWRD